MFTKIIEASSGKEIASGRNRDAVILKAIERQVANSDMLFVQGSEDIALHTFASKRHADFCRLIEVHRELHTSGYKVDLAPLRRDLWLRIKQSRETRLSETSRPLAEVVGQELANDLVMLMQLKDTYQVQVRGIDRQEVWRDLYYSAGLLARRYRDQRFNIMVHIELGLAVIARSDIFAGRRSFNVIDSVGPLRRPQ